MFPVVAVALTPLPAEAVAPAPLAPLTVPALAPPALTLAPVLNGFEELYEDEELNGVGIVVETPDPKPSWL